MSKEQIEEIEEIEREITDAWNNKCQLVSCNGCKYNDLNDNRCTEKLIADHLISKGYRKQSGWISVEERLPERTGKYLVATYDRRVGIGNFVDFYCDGAPQFDNYKVTHWMPLPELPKMEGGDRDA